MSKELNALKRNENKDMKKHDYFDFIFQELQDLLFQSIIISR